MKTAQSVADLELFARVASKGSMTAAARASGLSPGAVSKRMSRLEARLGATLMQRSTRRLVLTPIGQEFHERIGAILADLAEAEAVARGAMQEPSGLLRVTAPAAFARRFIASATSAFIARHPKVALELDMADQMVDLLDGRYDLAVRIADLADSSLLARRLGTNRRIVVAAPAYLARFGVPKTPSDLARHNVLISTSLRVPKIWTFVGKAGEARVKVGGNFASNNSDAIHQAVLDGLGIAFRSTWDVAEDVAAGRLRRVLDDYSLAPVGIWAVHPPSRNLPGKVRAFVAFLAERFAREVELSAQP